MKRILIMLSIYVMTFSCKKSSEHSTDLAIPTSIDSLTLATLEKSLDSVHNLPQPLTQGLAPGSIIALSNGNSDSIGDYIQGGIVAVGIMKKIYDVFYHYFSKKWTVIVWKDGYCCFNKVRGYRTIDDIVATACGRGGDCDWATFSGKKVCLRNKADARAMIASHGKIVRIAFIDHPTKNCGK